MKDFVDSNSDIDKDMFGNWIQILERDQRQVKIDKDHYDSKNKTQTSEDVLPSDPEAQPGSGDQDDQDGNQTRKVQVDQTSEAESATTQTQQVDIDEPREADFNLPDNEEAIQVMIDKMMDLGMTHNDATANIEKRRKQFNQATKKHQAAIKATRSRQYKSRKESLNDK